MDYKKHIGKQYRFKKGERVPQWIFKCEVAYFGTDVLVIPESDKLYIKGYCPYSYSSNGDDECLVRINNRNGEQCIQVCPQIHYYTNYKEIRNVLN